MSDILDKLKENAPDMVKENKGALIGAVIGYFLTDNRQAQSIILGALAGAVFVDNKKKKDNDYDEDDE